VSQRASRVLLLAVAVTPGIAGLVVLMLLIAAGARLSDRAAWVLVPVATVLAVAGAVGRLARMGHGRGALVAVGSGYAVLLGSAALWGLVTGDLFRALGLVLLAVAAGGLVSAVVSVTAGIRAERRAAAGSG